MEITVRPYQTSDRAAVLALVPRFTDFELPFWRQRGQIDDANRGAVSKALDRPAEGESVFVAEVDGSFAGFVHLQTKADHFTGEAVGYIADLAVQSGSEGMGVAGRLLDLAVDWAQARGFRLLTLDVFEGNERAKRLYGRHGFGRDTVQYTREVDQWRRRPPSWTS